MLLVVVTGRYDSNFEKVELVYSRPCKARLNFSGRVGGAVAIGQKLAPGDYILQVIVTDQAAKGRIATQFVQFEVVP